MRQKASQQSIASRSQSMPAAEITSHRNKSAKELDINSTRVKHDRDYRRITRQQTIANQSTTTQWQSSSKKEIDKKQANDSSAV